MLSGVFFILVLTTIALYFYAAVKQAFSNSKISMLERIEFDAEIIMFTVLSILCKLNGW